MSTSTPTSDAAPVAATPTPQQRRTTILASSVGTVIEWYDYMAYAFVAVTLAAVFFPAGNTATAVLSALAVFGVSFLLSLIHISEPTRRS